MSSDNDIATKLAGAAQRAERNVYIAIGICIGIFIGAAFATLDYSQGWGIARALPAARITQEVLPDDTN